MLQHQKIKVPERFNHFVFFKDVGFKFEKHVCNGCHDLLMIAHSLKNMAILNAKASTFRCLLMGI